jgi:MYXO-CTERM domain-containing protein
MRRSVVTRNYLKKYFGQLQCVAGAGLPAVALAGAGLLAGWRRRRSVK